MSVVQLIYCFCCHDYCRPTCDGAYLAIRSSNVRLMINYVKMLLLLLWLCSDMGWCILTSSSVGMMSKRQSHTVPRSEATVRILQ